MKKTIVSVMLITMCASVSWSETSGDGILSYKRSKDEPGFIELFDGKTFQGWKAADMSWWTVADGAITARVTKENPCRKNQYLFCEVGVMKDFELKLAHRIISKDKINCGFQFRSEHYKDADCKGYQVDNNLPNMIRLYDEFGRHTLAHRGQRSVFDESGKKITTDIPEAKSQSWFDLTEWHEYHLICRGSKLTLKVNGRLVAEVIDNDPKNQDLSGLLALQLHSGPPMTVQFKDIRWKPLEGDFNILEIERSRILRKAATYLHEVPRTVTADRCERSEGSIHDFYSEGDYWWPDPKNPDGPYIRRDGETYPNLFLAHRRSMVRLSDIIGTLTSAYIITQDDTYVIHAVKHLKAWFVDEETKMNPSLLYGQAIKGRATGRSIGIIDTIHLTEVARGVKILCGSAVFKQEDQDAVKVWFREYLTWINTHPYGKKEKVHNNNHGVCWSMQAAAFADLVGDEKVLEWIRNQFKKVYLDKMMDNRGGFPQELKRTKPYGYSLFVIDAMAGVAQIASTEKDDLWSYELPDGRGMKKGMEFIFPYINDKSTWPQKPDILYWDEWPVRQPSLLFAGWMFQNPNYLATWKNLQADPTTFEVLRNLPLRHPLLWIDLDSK